MVSVRKTLKCSCGLYMNFSFEADMPIDDLTVCGKCPSCGKTVQISVVSFEGGSTASAGTAESSSAPLDEAMREHKEDELGLDEADYSNSSSENVERALNEMFGE